MDQQTAGLTPGPAGEAWLRWFWLGDAYFLIGYLAISALMLTSADLDPVPRWAVVATLTAMAGWYVLFGRSAITSQRPATYFRGRVFAAGVVVLLAVAIAIDTSASFALFGACPLVFMSLQPREAVPVVIAINLLPPLSVLVRDGGDSLLELVGPGTVITIVFALAVGLWIHQIVTQSEERGELIRELEESREENARLSRAAGIAAERSRLAAEIHDTLAQGFTSLVTLVQAAESELDQGDQAKARRHLALAERTARENLGEARALVAGLMPSALGTASLDEAIRRQLDRLTEETPIRAEYHVDGELADLPTVIEVVLLRAVQESLTNVRKHAGAERVTIHLRVDETTARLTVTDDGRGFDPTRAFAGYGLRGMRSRAAQVGGTLTVRGPRHRQNGGQEDSANDSQNSSANVTTEVSTQAGTTVELEVPR